jgi:hypothetical protein
MNPDGSSFVIRRNQMKPKLKMIVFFLVSILILFTCGKSENERTGQGVLSISPSASESEVPLDSEIAIHFAPKIDPSSINNSTFIVTVNGRSIPGSVETDDHTAVFKPDVGLPPESLCDVSLSYKIILEGDSGPYGNCKWSFKTRDGAWNGVQRLDQQIDLNPVNPKLCVDPKGGAKVIWYISDNGIYVVQYDPSEGWTDEKLLSGDIPYSKLTNIATDDDGNSIAVWYGPSYDLGYSIYYTVGNGWTSPEYVYSGNNYCIVNIFSGMDNMGNIILLIRNSHPHGNDRIMRIYSPNTGWGGAKYFTQDSLSGYGGEDLYLNQSGYGIIAITYSNSRLEASNYNPDKGLQSLLKVESEGTYRPIYPNVSRTSSGNSFLIYRWAKRERSGPGLDKIYINRFDPENGWMDKELLSESGISNSRNPPKISVDDMGNIIGVWDELSGVFSRVVARRYVEGEGWSQPEMVGNVLDQHELSPVIVSDPYRNAVVAWIQNTDSGRKIYANRFIPSKGWLGARCIDTVDGGSSSDLSLSVNKYGQVFAAWSHTVDSKSMIYSNRFD